MIEIDDKDVIVAISLRTEYRRSRLSTQWIHQKLKIPIKQIVLFQPESAIGFWFTETRSPVCPPLNSEATVFPTIFSVPPLRLMCPDSVFIIAFPFDEIRLTVAV